MGKHAELAGLFVSATQTGYDVMSGLDKTKAFDSYSYELVSQGDTSCGDSDILVCSSYSCLLSVKDYLNAQMTVIVCDGPLVVSCLTTATALDFDRQQSYNFSFRPIDYRPVLKALRGQVKPVLLTADSFDVIGMVTANSMSGGLILTEFNKVQSYFDALARNRLRILFTELLDTKEPKTKLVELRDFLQAECTQADHLADAGAFFKKLVKGGALELLRQCTKEINAGKNIASVAKKNNVELFELNYIRKMTRNLDTAAGRTVTYAERTKSMVV